MAAVDLGITVSVLSPSFGSEIIQTFGTEDQKKKYISPLPKGEAVMGSAFTEPDAGSDLAAARTTAVKEGDEFVINGSKTFITNGTRADYLICFVQTNPEDPNIHHRHSMIMVETDSPYVSPFSKKGQRNEPVNVIEVVKKMAELRGRSFEEMAEITTRNAVRLFNLDIT